MREENHFVLIGSSHVVFGNRNVSTHRLRVFSVLDLCPADGLGAVSVHVDALAPHDPVDAEGEDAEGVAHAGDEGRATGGVGVSV